MSISALSVLTGMDRRTIGKRLENLDPVKVYRRAKQYDTSDALRAIYLGGDTGEALDVQQESAKLKRSQRVKLDLEISQLRGDLITGDQVKLMWADMVTAMRAKMLSLPPKLAVRVTGLETREVETESRALVFEALGSLAGDGSPGRQPSGDESVEVRSDGDDSASAGSDDKRVGRRKKSSVKRGKRGAGSVAD